MVFIVSATSCEFWCTLAVLNHKPAKTTAFLSSFFGVEKRPFGWFWGCSSYQNHRSNMMRFVETHGVKVLVYWSAGYVPTLRGIPYFLGDIRFLGLNDRCWNSITIEIWIHQNTTKRFNIHIYIHVYMYTWSKSLILCFLLEFGYSPQK